MVPVKGEGSSCYSRLWCTVLRYGGGLLTVTEEEKMLIKDNPTLTLDKVRLGV